MRVLMLSKALVLGAYQKKCEELARQPDIQLRVVVPPYWLEAGRRIYLERRYVAGYELSVRRMIFNGHFHIHFYPGLANEIAEFNPDLVHLDEEAYNVATAHGLWLSRRRGAKTLFFTWQNIYRKLPFPFSAIEAYCLANSDAAIAGNADAEKILRLKGFEKPIAVIPQFGVDPDLYSRANIRRAEIPGIDSSSLRKPFVIGYVGRLVPQKGLSTLLSAVAGLPGDWRLVLLGSGPFQRNIIELSTRLDISSRVIILPPTDSVRVPSFLAAMDTLVLPSLTTPNWKEQFGRVLIEAMACEVPVVGSSSGEIPNVIGEAGLVFREGDASDLREKLSMLMQDQKLREHLAQAGRERVLEHYTQARIAEATYRIYKQILQQS